MLDNSQTHTHAETHAHTHTVTHTLSTEVALEHTHRQKFSKAIRHVHVTRVKSVEPLTILHTHTHTHT